VFCVQCGKENPASGIFCWSCGKKLLKDEVRVQPLLGESQTTARAGPVAVRNKKNLVVPSGAILPQACVKCGAVGIPYSYTFAWMNPAYFALFVLGILPYFIIRLFLRKTVKLLVPLCEQHRGRARALARVGVITLIAAIPAGYGVYAAVGEADAAISGFSCAFLLIAVALILLWAHYPLRAVRIDKNGSVFQGANEAFLSLLSSASASNQ
jgi:Double zinc ribbon